jgi:hypothetical protein
MALTDLCLRDERPHFGDGVQRTYTLPNGYELSLINFPNAHIFPYAWEGAVINPRGKLDYDTPLTNDVEVFRTEEQTNAWIIRAIEWAVADKAEQDARTVINAVDPFHPAYGLPNTVRIRAVSLARDVSIKSAAAQCNVAESTVYKWVRAYANFASIK